MGPVKNLLLLLVCLFAFLAGCSSTEMLIEAAKRSDGEQVTKLLGENADINGKNEKGSTALMLAAYYGHTEVVTQLIDAGADVHEQDNSGWTALVYAVWNRKPAVIPMLIESGADVEAEVYAGKTVLEHAQERNLGDIVKLLRK